ncbi:hypothetical protein, partial [Mesorhizobium sp.]|uniref:hypothetical protein n=1 Tax=Mesorhizobium sp. TaxID=1871066 RepID=UPI0025BE766E
KRVWVFFAEGQRSLPHPHVPKKMRTAPLFRSRHLPRRRFRSTTIVSTTRQFGRYPDAVLQKRHDFAQVGKFSLTNLTTRVSIFAESDVREPIALDAQPSETELRFFAISSLIVPALFLIQRRDGEVAEWSKALPC